jgi:hypothetical protein
MKNPKIKGNTVLFQNKLWSIEKCFNPNTIQFCIVIVSDKKAFVDYPILYDDGNIRYDFPEKISPYIKNKVVDFYSKLEKLVQINTFEDLREGENFLMINKQFDNAFNEVRVICNDFTELKRDIKYLQFMRYNNPIITKEKFIENITSNKLEFDTFALWKHDFNSSCLFFKK